MKKILILILSLSLLLLSGCSKTIYITFMVGDQTAFQVEGKSPVTLNESDFVIDEELVKVTKWLDEEGNEVDFSKPFKKDTTVYGDATYYYIVNWKVEDEIAQTDIVKQDDPITLPERIPTIDGYLFTGWIDDDGVNAKDYTSCTKDVTFVAQYEPTLERIVIVNETLTFSGPNASWQRAGVTDNMGYPLTFTPSNPEVATYYDTHIFPHASGTCVFTITSESGLVKYLTVVVN